MQLWIGSESDQVCWVLTYTKPMHVCQFWVFFSERKWSHWNIRPWNGRHPLSLHDRWTQASLGNINFAFLYQIPRKGILLWKCLLIHRLHLNVNKMTPFEIQLQGARIISWFMDELFLKSILQSFLVEELGFIWYS